MPVGDANERGDIIRRQAFEIAQHHDLALHIGQLWQQLLDAPGEALGHDAVVGTVGPRLGWCDPGSRRVELQLDVVARAARRAARGPLSTGHG